MMNSGNPTTSGNTEIARTSAIKSGLKSASMPRKVLQTTKVTPAIKHSIVLPDPEYRNVAGGVTRKSDNTTRAEPPPSNSRRVTSTAQNQRARRKRTDLGGSGAGSGSDSDSDSGPSPRFADDEDGSRVSRRRRTEGGDTPGGGRFNDHVTRGFENEENERMRLFRVLREVGNKWDTIRLDREKNRQKARWEMDELLYQTHRSDYWENVPADLARIHVEISKWDSYLQHFLDEALFGEAEDKFREEGLTGEGTRKPLDYLEDVLRQVEIGVVLRDVRRPDYWKPHEWSTSRMMHHLSEAAERLCGDLWEYLISKDDQNVNIASETMKFLERTYPESMSSSPSVAMLWLENAYLAKVTECIVENFPVAQITDNHHRAATIEIPITMIMSSRHDGHLTLEYMDQICSMVPTSVVEQSCIQWKENLRAKLVRTYREMMKSVIELRQEFCLDIVQPGSCLWCYSKATIPQPSGMYSPWN